MKAWAVIVSVLAACLTVVAAELQPKLPAPPQGVSPRKSASAEITPEALSAALLAETNRVRLQFGCRPLHAQEELKAAADDQAVWMAMHLSASHSNPFYDQRDVSERVARHGYRPTAVAENVASLPTAREGDPSPCTTIAVSLVDAWLRSPGHRANLLNRNFTRLGCAARVAPGFNGVEYVFGAQVFSTTPPATELQL